jgi:hypothetical protein
LLAVPIAADEQEDVAEPAVTGIARGSPAGA